MSNIDAEKVRKGHEIDIKSLEQYFKKHINIFGNSIVEVLQFRHGQSNPTYYIRDDIGNEFVLRKKPHGKLLPSAVCLSNVFTLNHYHLFL